MYILIFPTVNSVCKMVDIEGWTLNNKSLVIPTGYTNWSHSHRSRGQYFNSLAPQRSHFKSINFKLIIQKTSLGTRCKTALWWMPQNLTNEQLLMRSYNLGSGDGLVPPGNKSYIASQWFNSLPPGRCGCDFKCVIFKPLLVSDIVSISSDYCHQVNAT